MTTKLGIFPLEVWEKVLEYLVLTVNPHSKHLSAILSVCSAWNQVAEPLLYQHVVIFEGSNKLEGLRSLAETIDRYPNYAARVSTLTVRFSATRLWDELSEDEAVERFRFLGWMQEMKSLSIVVVVSHKRDADGMRWLANKVTKKIPPTCQSLELKLRCTDHSILSYEYYPDTKSVHIPASVQNLRLEILTDPCDAIQSLTRGDLKQLKKVVIVSDRLARYRVRATREMGQYSRYVASAIITKQCQHLKACCRTIRNSSEKMNQHLNSISKSG